MSRLALLFGRLFQEGQDLLDSLPQVVVDAIPIEDRQEIVDKGLDAIPSSVIKRLPPDVVDRIPSGLIESASSNPALTGALVLVGVLAVAGVIWGLVKGLIKLAVVLGIVAALAWYFFLREV